MIDKQILNIAYGNMVENRYRQQASVSLSPELLSLLEDLRDTTNYNRSQLVEKAVWFAVKAGFLDVIRGDPDGNSVC